MKIIGISEEHDAGTALVENWKIIKASNEERYSGRKFHYGFPFKSLRWLSGNMNSQVKKKMIVAVASIFHVSENLGEWQNMPIHYRLIEFFLSVTSLDRLLWGTNIGPNLLKIIARITNLFRKKRIIFQLAKLSYSVEKFIFVDHHTCHAAAGYYQSGWKKCLVITQDASGDGFCSKVFKADGGNLKEVHSIPFFHSPGHYYEYVTLLLGFKIGREGKVTGLAGSGDSTKTYPIFAGILTYDKNKHSFYNRGRYRISAILNLKKQLRGFSARDIAAGVQKHLESVMTVYIKDMTVMYGNGKPVSLVLSGGVFANVKLNQVISQLKEVGEIFVFPHMGDGGLAVGAALYAENLFGKKKVKQTTLNNVYLGEGISENDIILSLKTSKSDIEAYKPEKLSLTAAKLLSQGKTVAVVQGKMEYGPRALGHRSILYQATDPTVNIWLNKRLKRSEFMPFAPILQEVKVKDYFLGWEKLTQPLKFMTTTVYCNKKCRKEAPAIVHKDSTARPQTVSKKSQPFIYNILTDYYKLTGLNILINTSFNMHESPIVRTASDAILTYNQSELDFLIINNWLIYRKINL